MVALRVNVLVLLASSLSVVPQAAYLRSHAATGATSFAKEELSASGKASGSDQSTAAEFEDPADDARAEAGAEVDTAFGAGETDDQDYLEVPDAEASLAKPFDPPSENERGVYNLETGRFEKSAVLLQVADVDDVEDVEEQLQAGDQSEDETSDDGEEEEASDDSDEQTSVDGEEEAATDDSEDQSSDDGEEEEATDDSEDETSDDVEESGDAADESDASDDTDGDFDESLIQTSDVEHGDDHHLDDVESDENDSAEPAGTDDDSDEAALLQKAKSVAGDEDDSDDLDADTRMGQDDAKAAEAEALKEAGGEEDEEKRAEREEAEQEEIETMNADSAYNFDGIS